MLFPLVMIIDDFPAYLNTDLIQSGMINIQYWLKRHQEASADNRHIQGNVQ